MMTELDKIKLRYSIMFLIVGLFVGFIVGKLMIGSSASANLSESNEPITIGFIGPLTGENANIGIPIRRGVELAVEDVNSAGGVNGRQLVAIFEDGKCNAKEANTAAMKLFDQDNVIAVVGGVCSSETLAIAPAANEEKIPIISPSSTNPKITDAGDYVFRVVGSDALQGKIMAEYIFSEGYTKVALIYQNSDYNIGLKNVFTETFEELGGEIVAAENYESDAKDYKTQLTKIKAVDPEALYIIPYSEGGLIVKQAKELDLETQLFGPETFESESMLKDGGDAMEGLVFTKPRFDERNPQSKKVLDKFRLKYKERSEFPAYMTNAYDIVMLITEALNKEVSSESIKNFLYTVKNYDGAGGELTIDKNGDALKDFTFMEIKDGKFVSYVSYKEDEKQEVDEDVQEIKVDLEEYSIAPLEIKANPGKIRFTITNSGTLYHEFEIEGEVNNEEFEKEIAVPAGKTVNLEVDLPKGTYKIYCPVPGHKEAGMLAELSVK